MSTNAAAPPEEAPEHAALVDDAALLDPPSQAGVTSLAEAVGRHRELLSSHAHLVRSLVVPDPMLPALLDLPELAGDPLSVTVAVSGGAGGMEPAARWAARPALRVTTLAATLRDLDDLAGAARRTATAAQQAVDAEPALADTTVSVGMPLDAVGRPGWEAALDELAMADLVVAFRTGEHGALPPRAVVDAVDAALDREVALRFTGAHPAVTRGGRPGYRNLLLAVRLTLDGQKDEAEAVLAEGDQARLDARAAELESDALVRVRRWLRSVEARLS